MKEIGDLGGIWIQNIKNQNKYNIKLFLILAQVQQFWSIQWSTGIDTIYL